MELHLLEASAYIQPSFPVEFSVNVDNRPLRIEIPWETVEILLGTKVQEEQLVRDYLSRNRDKIMIAIQSHLAAQGFPLGGVLVLTVTDFLPATPSP